MAWKRRGADLAELEALHSGVPAWMERQLLGWATFVGAEEYHDEWGNTAKRPSISVLMGYETAVRRKKSLVEGYRAGGATYLLSSMGHAEFLDYIDYLVYVASQKPSAETVLGLLERVLSEGGSEWSVAERDGHPALEKRVPEGVALAAVEVIRSAPAGTLLAEAWHAAFGRSPDTEEAYEKAIKAVEEAGASVVAPKSSKGTLGTMVRDMKAQKDWKLDLPASDADVPVKMAEALWVGQESRHGGNGYRKPTQAEAEAAVLLAVPLVQWFSSGAVARRP